MNNQVTFETLLATKVAEAVVAMIEPELRQLRNSLIKQSKVKPEQYMGLKDLANYFGYGYRAMFNASKASTFPNHIQMPSGEDGEAKTQPRWRLSDVEKYMQKRLHNS